MKKSTNSEPEHLALSKLKWSIDSNIKTPQINKNEVNYIDSLIKLAENNFNKKYSSILDIPCGTGRLHDFLRSRGYEVYGVDLNKHFIKEAKKTQKNPENYYVGNMKNFNLRKKFDVILSWFTSFGYLDEKENSSTLRNFSKHLNKNGLIIIDVKNSDCKTESTFPFCNEYGNFLRMTKVYNENRNNKTYSIFDFSLYKKSGKNLMFLKKSKIPIRSY